MRNIVVGPLLAKYVRPGGHVLDLGGYDGSATEELVARGARVSLVDLDRAGIEIARTKGIDAICASAEALPFPDRHFDVVVCCDLLPSVPLASEEQVFREMVRVLKPDGVLIFTVPDESLHLPFVDMKAAYVSWRSRHGISKERLSYLAELAEVEVLSSRDYFGLATRLYYGLAFYRNLPPGGTRVKRALWRHLVAGERWFCFAPQAHLIVARPRS